jgi:antitoxin component YwqK of YwqJK toxin-antitoxin module
LEFYSNGNPKLVSKMRDNRFIEDYREFYEEGSPKVIGQYVEHNNIIGDRGGKWLEYYVSGDKKSQGKYNRGRQVGKWIYWDERGKKTKKSFD